MEPPHIPGFAFTTPLGRGAFGAVWRATWNQEFPCAVKVLTPGRVHTEYLSWCLERLRERGPVSGVIRTYAFDLVNEPPHLSTELIPEGAVSFRELAGRLPRHEAWPLLESVARTLAAMHRQRIVHAGLTDGNAFVYASDAGEPLTLLTDPGQGWLGNLPAGMLHFQAPFIAPDRWRTPSQILEGTSSETWDVYAFGVLAWRLLNNTWPRGGQVFDAIRQATGEELNLEAGAFADWLEKEPPTAWSSGSDDKAERERRRIVEKCLSVYSATRYNSMVEVEAALRAAPAVTPDPSSTTTPAAEPRTGATATVPLTGTVFVSEAATLKSPSMDTTDSVPVPLPLPQSGLGGFPDTGLVPPSAGRAYGRGGSALWKIVSGVCAAAAIGGGLAAVSQSKQAAAAEQRTREAGESLARVSAELREVEDAAAAAKVASDEAVKMTAVASRRDAFGEAARQIVSTAPGSEDGLEQWREQNRPFATAAVQAVQESMNNPAAAETSLAARSAIADLAFVLGEGELSGKLADGVLQDLEARSAAGKLLPEDGLIQARALARRGAIRVADGRTADALEDLKVAAAKFEEWIGAHADDRTAVREYARSSLLEGQAMVARGLAAEARPVLARVTSLIGTPGTPGYRPDDVFVAVDAMHETSLVEQMAGGQTKTAASLQEDLIRQLLVYEAKDQRSVACRYRLARAYMETGRLILKEGVAYDASVAYREAVRFLTDLQKDYPERVLFRYDLARTYTDVAALKARSDTSTAALQESLAFVTGSAELLKDLCEKEAGRPDFRRAHAEALIAKSGYSAALGQTDTAVAGQKEALDILGVLAEDTALTESARREIRLLSARTFVEMAGAQQKAGRPEDARAAVIMLDETLAPLLEANPQDADAATLKKAGSELRAKLPKKS